jgi:hypothetical protein
MLSAVAFAASCSKEQYCVEGLDIGTTYQVTVLGPADANSQYGVRTSNGPNFGINLFGLPTCGAGFDFVAGSIFTVEPVSKQDLGVGCDGRIAIPSSITEIQLGGYQTATSIEGGPLMQTPMYEADHGGGCVGQWQLGFISPRDEPPLDAPVPGEYPPVLLGRTFQPPPTTDIQSCLLPDSKLAEHGYCTDYFVVALEKI